MPNRRGLEKSQNADMLQEGFENGKGDWKMTINDVENAMVSCHTCKPRSIGPIS